VSRSRIQNVFFLGLILSVGTALSAQECKDCDCYHFPIPKKCDKCCSKATGKIVSVTDTTVELVEKATTNEGVAAKKTFALKPDTKRNAPLKEGALATIYYRKDGNQAEQIDVVGAIQGLLVPDDEPDPPGPAPCPVLPSGALKVFLGKSVAWSLADEVTILRIKGIDVLSLTRTPNGMAIQAKTFSEDGRLVAEIVDNRFYINPDNFFLMKKPDAHSLVVYDKQGRKVLNLRYLNPHSVTILGIFQVLGSLPVVITADAFLAEGSQMTNSCIGGGRLLFSVD
jgi:hypothetical protein